jgi:RND family efflux transporter MFP subunit
MRNSIFALCLCYLASSALFAADYQGSLDWSARAELGTLVSGVVDKVNVKAGQTVSKGDVLLQLDERDFIYQVASAKAIYQRSEANYEEAKREHERSVELYDRRLLSDHELQLKKIGLLQAQAAMELAQSASELALLDLERSVLKAPFDGLVINVLVNESESVLSRLQVRPLVVVAATGSMNAVARIDSKAAAKLKEGTPASVGIGGDWLIGSVVQVGNEPVQVTDKDVFYLLTATFTPGEAKLRAGEKAIIRIQE